MTWLLTCIAARCMHQTQKPAGSCIDPRAGQCVSQPQGFTHKSPGNWGHDSVRFNFPIKNCAALVQELAGKKKTTQKERI